MKQNLFILFSPITLLIWGCQNKEPEEIPEIEPPVYINLCERTEETYVDTVFQDFVCPVEFHHDTTYLLKVFMRSSKIQTGYLVPCSLPKEFRKNGLLVKFSGDVISYPDIDSLDRLGETIQLTSIEIINK